MTPNNSILERARRPRILVAMAAFIAVVGVAMSPQLAHAHDQLVENTPTDNEVFSEAPEEVVLRYNNSVLDIGEGATIVNVVDAEGTSVVDGPPEVSGPHVTQGLADLAEGAYRVTWRVVSSDGHPISGTFLFAVGDDGEEALASMPEPSETSDDGTGAAQAEENTSGTEGAQAADAQADEGSMTVPMMLIIGAAAVTIVVASILLMKRKSAGPPTTGS